MWLILTIASFYALLVCGGVGIVKQHRRQASAKPYLGWAALFLILTITGLIQINDSANRETASSVEALSSPASAEPAPDMTAESSAPNAPSAAAVPPAATPLTEDARQQKQYEAAARTEIRSYIKHRVQSKLTAEQLRAFGESVKDYADNMTDPQSGKLYMQIGRFILRDDFDQTVSYYQSAPEAEDFAELHQLPAMTAEERAQWEAYQQMPGNITWDEALQLKEGMTYEQVKAITGDPGKIYYRNPELEQMGIKYDIEHGQSVCDILFDHNQATSLIFY